MCRNIRIKFLSWRYMYAVDRQTDRQTETDWNRQRQKQTDRETDRQTDNSFSFWLVHKSPQITIRKRDSKMGHRNRHTQPNSVSITLQLGLVMRSPQITIRKSKLNSKMGQRNRHTQPNSVSITLQLWSVWDHYGQTDRGQTVSRSRYSFGHCEITMSRQREPEPEPELWSVWNHYGQTDRAKTVSRSRYSFGQCEITTARQTGGQQQCLTLLPLVSVKSRSVTLGSDRIWAVVSTMKGP